eukprot:364958-Chlamydomonas_euryale.AAC.2
MALHGGRRAAGAGRRRHLVHTHALTPHLQVSTSDAPGGGEALPAGPPLSLRWETDIFSALGLDYVPPHMRELIIGG